MSGAIRAAWVSIDEGEGLGWRGISDSGRGAAPRRRRKLQAQKKTSLSLGASDNSRLTHLPLLPPQSDQPPPQGSYQSTHTRLQKEFAAPSHVPMPLEPCDSSLNPELPGPPASVWILSSFATLGWSIGWASEASEEGRWPVGLTFVSSGKE